jgi:hypothetical protein
MKFAAAVGLVFAMSACGPKTAGRESSPRPTDTPVVSTDVSLSLAINSSPPLRVGEMAEFRLDLVANRSLELEFPSSQRFELVVNSGGNRVWSSSEDKLYAQVLGTEALERGERLTYREKWEPTTKGDFSVLGRITAGNRDDLEVKKSFSVE